MNEDKKNTKVQTIISKAYFKQGLSIFLVGLALIICYYYINHFSVISSNFSKINGILTPFYLGMILAYLLCPLYNATVKGCYAALKNKLKTPKKALKLSRVIASVVSIIVIIVIVVGLILMIIPSLYESVSNLVPKLPGYFNSTVEMIESHLNDGNEVGEYISKNLDDLSGRIGSWLETKLLPASEVIFQRVSSGVVATIGGILDCLIALIICVYILNSKELFMAQAKKLIKALFSKERAEGFFELCRLSNNTFGGFINGKVIDSLIIGIICFIAMTIMNLPMAMLISVTVGITNIIPFFGPFIGAVPSALLLVLMDPIAALKFIIMVFVLQQVDGNIIGPKILGKATKLSSFWVMFAIIVGGGLFGFLGMILGVPVFAILYTYIARWINRLLEKKHIDSDTLAYEDFTKYGASKTELFGRERVKDEPKETKDTVSES